MKSISQFSLACLCLSIPLFLGCRPDPRVTDSANAPAVIFVCEHGNKKSVMAATLFNKLAAERHSPLRALARGAHAEGAVPPEIVDALRTQDGGVAAMQATQLTASDVHDALRVVTIGVALDRATSPADSAVEAWSDVPSASSDYQASRSSLLHHVAALLDQLDRAHARDEQR